MPSMIAFPQYLARASGLAGALLVGLVVLCARSYADEGRYAELKLTFKWRSTGKPVSGLTLKITDQYATYTNSTVPVGESGEVSLGGLFFRRFENKQDGGAERTDYLLPGDYYCVWVELLDTEGRKLRLVRDNRDTWWRIGTAAGPGHKPNSIVIPYDHHELDLHYWVEPTQHGKEGGK